MKKKQFIILTCLLFLFTACSDSPKQALEKNQDAIPNAILADYTSAASKESFIVNTEESQELQSKRGSVLSIPQGAFLDENGDIWKGEARLELIEMTNPSDLLLNQVSMEAKEGILKNYGIVQLQAFADGKKLSINPENSPYLDFAIEEESIDAELMVYEGIRDGAGVMKWENPEPSPKFLIPMDFDVLDFYPKNFEQTVEKYMPYKSYKTATKSLKDSLFYSLRPWLNEGENSSMIVETDSTSEFAKNSINCSGIDPAIVKTIRHKKFENTFLATREFAERLRALYKTCDNTLLEMYINNLDKNLWEIDQLVAAKESPQKQIFENFAKQKLTNTEGGEKYANRLKSFYAKKLKANRKAIEKAAREYREALRKKAKEIEQKREEYRKVLQKRQKYRLRKQGIVIKKNSPYTLCQVLEKLDTFELEVKVENPKRFDRVHVYVVDPVIKSLFALRPDGQGVFNQGYEEDWALVMRKQQAAYIVGVAYKNDSAFVVEENFILKKVNSFTISPQFIPKPELKSFLKKFDQNRRGFNKIRLDLEYQELFYQEQIRKKQLEQEQEMMGELMVELFSCCFNQNELTGKVLFERDCSQCHGISKEMVGPALAHISRRRSMDWLIAFTKYPQKVIDSGDPYAAKLYKKYKQYMPNCDFLTNQEIEAIYAYIDKMSLSPDTH